jgi:hypothetical protein
MQQEDGKNTENKARVKKKRRQEKEANSPSRKKNDIQPRNE